MGRLIPHLANGAFVLTERGADKTLDSKLESLGVVAMVPEGVTHVS